MNQKKVVRIAPDGDPVTGMIPANIVPPDDFTTDDHSELIHTAFATKDGRASAGVWECAPCRTEVDRFGIDEMLFMISGAIVLTHPDGSADRFTRGDAFLIPSDFTGVIEVQELTRAYWMLYSNPTDSTP